MPAKIRNRRSQLGISQINRALSARRRNGVAKYRTSRRYAGWRDYASPIVTGAKMAMGPVYYVYRGGKWVLEKVAEHPYATAAIIGTALAAGGMARGYYSPTDMLPTSLKTKAADILVSGGHELMSRGKMAYDEFGNAIGYAAKSGRSLVNVGVEGFNAARNALSPSVAIPSVYRAARSSWRSAKHAAYGLEAGAAGVGNALRMWRNFGIDPIIGVGKVAMSEGAKAMNGTTPYRGVFEPLHPSSAASHRHFNQPIMQPNGDLFLPNTPKWQKYIQAAGIAASATTMAGGILVRLAPIVMALASASNPKMSSFV